MPENRYDSRDVIQGIYDAEAAQEQEKEEQRQEQEKEEQRQERYYSSRIRSLLDYTVSEIQNMPNPPTCQIEVTKTTTVHKTRGFLSSLLSGPYSGDGYQKEVSRTHTLYEGLWVTLSIESFNSKAGSDPEDTSPGVVIHDKEGIILLREPQPGYAISKERSKNPSLYSVSHHIRNRVNVKYPYSHFELFDFDELINRKARHYSSFNLATLEKGAAAAMRFASTGQSPE